MREYKVKEPKLTQKEAKRGIIIKEYNCGYCGFLFKQKVLKDSTSESKRSNWSSQVRCPYCKNFAKTWDEGKEVKP